MERFSEHIRGVGSVYEKDDLVGTVFFGFGDPYQVGEVAIEAYSCMGDKRFLR
jgi:hypothetical protein